MSFQRANLSQIASALTALANVQVTPVDEFAAFASDSAHPGAQQMRDILARRAAEKNAKATEEAADFVLQAVETGEAMINSQREAIAAARRQMESARNYLENIAVARVYGERTMNWLPLAVQVGMVTPVACANNVPGSVTSAAYTVPEAEYKEILTEIKAKQAEQATAKKCNPAQTAPVPSVPARKRATKAA